jgi:hypothetical protein
LDEEGHGTHYKEDEFSPRNVMFDALIEKKPGEPPVVRTYWDDNDLGSTVKVMGAWFMISLSRSGASIIRQFREPGGG